MRVYTEEEYKAFLKDSSLPEEKNSSITLDKVYALNTLTAKLNGFKKMRKHYEKLEEQVIQEIITLLRE